MTDPEPSEPTGPPAGSARARPGGEALPSPGQGASGGPDRLVVLLWLVVLAVAAVRFVRLGDWSLWIDEAFTLSDSLHADRFANPIGYLLFGGFYEALGVRPDEFALRLPSALFGVASVVLCAWAFRPHAGPLVSVAAALLLASSSWHLYWSQNARFYTLAMALSLLGTGVYLRGLRRDSVLVATLGLALAASAAGAHLTAVFVLPGLVLLPILEAWFRARRSSEHPPEEPSLSSARLVRAAWVWMVTGILLAVLWGLDRVEEWQGLKRVVGFGHLALTVGFFFTPLLLMGALIGSGLGLARGLPTVRAAGVVVVVGFVSAAVIATVARMTAQYVFLLLPWVCLLAALPLDERALWHSGLPGERALRDYLKPRRMGAAYLALLVLPSLTNCLLQLTVRSGERPPWREAYTLVYDNLRPGDLVMGMSAAVGEYYFDAEETFVRYPDDVVYLDRYRWDTAETWDRTGRRTWFVVNHEELDDWKAPLRRRFEQLLREECRCLARFPLIVESRDLSVYVYLRE